MNQPLGDFTVPSWIKSNAGWWADDQIDDSSFVSGLQWLISNDVIMLPTTEQGTVDDENIIPGWIKNTAGWWADDQIHDITFVAAIKYLIGEGIIIIEQETEVEVVEELVEVEEVKEFHMVVNGGNCCFNWAHVGEEYRFQIEIFDEFRGSPIDGVTITAKIISNGGELRYDFGRIITEDGIYRNSITIPNIDWYAENILSVTAEYNGIEKTIEEEFEVFIQKRGGNECESENPFDLSGWETLPTGITFESGGSKMFVIGSTGDDVNEYTMNPPWCIGNAQFMDSFSVSGQETSPQSLAFSTDGKKMFILGITGKDVTEYTLGTAFDVSTATYVDEKSVDQGTNYDKPRAIDFSSDGTKMRILWSDKDVVGEYVCSTGFDVSTCSYTSSEPTDISDEEAIPEGIAFNTDGTKMFVVGREDAEVNEYACTTGFDVSSCSHTSPVFSVSKQDGTPRGIAFNADGTKMFIVGKDGDDVNEYACTTGFDVSTCTVDSGDPFSVSSDDSEPSGIAFNTDGTKMFVLGANGEDVNEYVCSTGFDVSTCGSVADKDISGQEANALAMAFNSDGTKMFIGGFAGDDVNEYTLSTAYDVSTATFVDAFSILTHEGKITGLAFDTNGHRMFIVDKVALK